MRNRSAWRAASAAVICWSGLFLSPPLVFAASDATAPVAQTLTVGSVKVQIGFGDTGFGASTALVVAWIERSVHTVTDYYGQFPVTNLRIRITPFDGAGVRGGTTYGSSEPLIRVRVGRESTEEQLANDWVLVHEMVHLALPEVGRRHAWLAEGLATYIEGVARVQAGNRAPAAVWSEYMRSMPLGLPRAGDEGLDNTHTWGRTYWGGALFCLLADVEIRTRTDNKLGLQDAMRAVATSSGGMVTDWSIERVLATGDAATGTSALEDLYEQMKDTPVTPDLPALWERLGVERDGDTVKLRADAPLARIREAIMQPRRR